MIERMVLFFINAPKEKKMEGKGVVLNPNNQGLKEISESLIIDGALPNQINKIILDSAPDVSKKSKDSINIRLGEIRDSLILDGADNKTIGQVISETKKEYRTAKNHFLNRRNPVVRIDLSQYSL